MNVLSGRARREKPLQVGPFSGSVVKQRGCALRSQTKALCAETAGCRHHHTASGLQRAVPSPDGVQLAWQPRQRTPTWHMRFAAASAP